MEPYGTPKLNLNKVKSRFWIECFDSEWLNSRGTNKDWNLSVHNALVYEVDIHDLQGRRPSSGR